MAASRLDAPGGPSAVCDYDLQTNFVSSSLTARKRETCDLVRHVTVSREHDHDRGNLVGLSESSDRNFRLVIHGETVSMSDWLKIRTRIASVGFFSMTVSAYVSVLPFDPRILRTSTCLR